MPEGGLRSRLVGDGQMRCPDRGQLLMQAVDPGDDQAGGEQGALDRVGGFTAEKHLLDVVHLGREEIGQGGARRRHWQVHLRRKGIVPPFYVGGKAEVLDQAIGKDDRRDETVEVFEVVGDRVVDEAFQLVDGGEDVVESRAPWS